MAGQWGSVPQPDVLPWSWFNGVPVLPGPGDPAPALSLYFSHEASLTLQVRPRLCACRSLCFCELPPSSSAVLILRPPSWSFSWPPCFHQPPPPLPSLPIPIPGCTFLQSIYLHLARHLFYNCSSWNVQTHGDSERPRRLINSLYLLPRSNTC